MIDILKKLYTSKELAEYYTYETTTEFDVGIIIAVNENEFALQSFSISGNRDGIVAYTTNNIFKIQTNTKYIEKIKKLSDNISLSDTAKKINKNAIFNYLLHISQKNKTVLSIKLLANDNEDFTGFVEEINDNHCKFRVIDEYGYDDGFVYFKTRDITELAYMCDKEYRFMKLWQINHSETQRTQCDDSSVCD